MPDSPSSKNTSAAAGTPGVGGRRLGIHKYPNRRYYDTTRSRHVTLEEIYSLIRDGYDVQVVDSKTGQDITARILAQIIIDMDSPKLGVFPVALLHRLLRSNQEIVSDFVEKYLNQPLGAFLDSQRNMEQYFRQAMGFQSPSPTMADWAKMMWGPFNPSFWSQGGTPAGTAHQQGSDVAGEAAPPTSAGATSAAQGGEGQQLPELKQQLELLRRQVGELQAELGRRRSGEGGGIAAGAGGGSGGGAASSGRRGTGASRRGRKSKRSS
jgi:polyhydroxyalkanoate synthesis repressor PhaR